ncbi:unnamed protein product [Heterobilharzia americana]|nr:unnamed protein product [Heterobilharzia americana]
MQVEYKFQVDYAKSSRSRCTKCKIEIDQNSLRIARLVQAPNFDGKIPRWFHYRCFWGSKMPIECTAEIKHFDSIRWEDQEKIRTTIAGESASSMPAGKVPTRKFSVKLADSNLTCSHCQKPLMHERHTVCESGKKPIFMCHLSCFLKSNDCPEDISQLTGFRKLPAVDREAIQISYAEISKENRKRPAPQPVEQNLKSKKVKVNDDTEQLSVNSIVVSTLSEMKSEKNVDINTVAASKEAITTARAYGLRVISETFLSEFNSSKSDPKKFEGKIQQLLAKHTISNWEVKVRASKVDKWEKKLGDLEGDDQEMMRMTLKNGAVVDPQSELENKASVLKDEKGEFMTAVLGMVDLVKGSNSFYKLQALQSDKSARCWVFRAWGRIGTPIGGTKTESYPNATSARAAFRGIYLEKTGNQWDDRKNFRKIPHKFYEMELDYNNASNTKEIQSMNSSVPSKLHPTIQSLLKFICDIKSMEKAMAEFELDLRKMPLGKLSRNQIREAYEILNSLSQLVSKKASRISSKNKSQPTSLDQTQVLSESTRFYTLIPHDFGMKTPPLLDNKKVITTKIRMLEDLLEIELAYKMLQTKGDSEKNPLDEHYDQLHTKLEPLDSNCENYKRILDYVRETHGATHTQYTLEVLDIFEVHRDGEEERYAKCKIAQHNKQLLWHGSRQTNWIGILSQGLRIAPPEAPVTGYMFGKGIYFADIVSKSANYCFATQSQPEGVLLLCEVILGDVNECLQADATDLPPKYHSRKGVGSVTPDPSTHYTNEEGVVYPIGKPVDSKVPNTTLCYNEYIVYNASQVKQKYLVRVKFLYK